MGGGRDEVSVFFFSKDCETWSSVEWTGGCRDLPQATRNPQLPGKDTLCHIFKSKCGLVNLHDGLYELRSEREALPLRGHSSLGHIVELRCEAILLPNLHPINICLKSY